MRRIAVAFLTIGLAMASAKSYTVNIFEPAVLAGQELKAGEYKLELTGNKMTLKAGKQVAESNVTVENLPSPNPTTSMKMDTTAGKPQIKEIRLGGTKMKLVVN